MTTTDPAWFAGIDADLPGLGDAFSPVAAARAYAAAWDVEVSGCALLTTRFEPGVRCVTTHAVRLTAGGVPTETIGVFDVRRDGTSVRRFEGDPDLPGLRVAADAGQIAAMLGWAECEVRPVAYRPGQRAVLRYAHTGAVSYGKVLCRHADDLAAVVDELHRRSVADPALPFVPRVEAFRADLALVILSEVEGPSLSDVSFGRGAVSDGVDAMRRTGRALARLHGTDVIPARSVRPEDDLDEVGSCLSAVRCAEPALASRLARALERAAGHVPVGPVVPSHGALRTDQVVMAEGRPAFLDLDGFATADPARDLGNVLAYLRWRAIRHPGQQAAVDAVRRALLDGYRDGAAAVDGAPLRWYEGTALLKIAARPFRRLAVAEFALVPELLDACDALADER